MVELSIILDKFPGKRELILELARLIKGHGEGVCIARSAILGVLSGEDDEDAFIDVLIDSDVLRNSVQLKECCESPFVETNYCFSCGEDSNWIMKDYYEIVQIINFVDDWRKDTFEELSHKIPYSDLEYVNLICSQVRSLERNPIIPLSERTKEKQYQFVGYRILSHLYETEMECLTEDGRSDLKFKKPGERIDYVGEYKIWSRRSGTDLVADQCLNYFSSDTESSFIFMVNDSKNDIWQSYLGQQVLNSQHYIANDSIGFLVQKDRYGINIYHSVHLCPTTGKKASIYHFIYDLYGNFGGR